MKCLSIVCQQEAWAKGLCNKHYRILKKGGDYNVRTYKDFTTEEKFLSKVKKGEKPDDCWIWTWHTRGNDKLQYGKFHLKMKVYSAHRFAWTLWRGELPKSEDREICVCHTCDNTLCVNPDHLFLGSHLQNMQDKVAKGRDVGSIKECKRGHEFNEKNTWICKQGLRHCRECARLREATKRAKNKRSV